MKLAAGRLGNSIEYRSYGRLKSVPPFDEDDEHDPPAGVDDWRASVEWADGLLIATPEYNASIPGQLKNAVDWASRPALTAVLREKPVAVIGASASMFGAAWSQAHLRAALGAAGARVVDRELAVAEVEERLSGDGLLLETQLLTELDEIVGELVAQLEMTADARA
jgi:chromate reductase